MTPAFQISIVVNSTSLKNPNPYSFRTNNLLWYLPIYFLPNTNFMGCLDVHFEGDYYDLNNHNQTISTTHAHTPLILN